MAENVHQNHSTPLQANLVDLVREHADDLYRYAFRLSGNQPDAEDLVQQTFVQATASIQSLREPAKGRSWLFTILRNVFFKICKQRSPTPVSNVAMEVDEIPATIADDPIDEQALMQGLNELSDEHRVVLVMYYFEELSYQEIAASLDWPIGTVMSRLSRAKAKLRGKLATHFPEWQPDSQESGGNTSGQRPIEQITD